MIDKNKIVSPLDFMYKPDGKIGLIKTIPDKSNIIFLAGLPENIYEYEPNSWYLNFILDYQSKDRFDIHNDYIFTPRYDFLIPFCDFLANEFEQLSLTQLIDISEHMSDISNIKIYNYKNNFSFNSLLNYQFSKELSKEDNNSDIFVLKSNLDKIDINDIYYNRSIEHNVAQKYLINKIDKLENKTFTCMDTLISHIFLLQE